MGTIDNAPELPHSVFGSRVGMVGVGWFMLSVAEVGFRKRSVAEVGFRKRDARQEGSVREPMKHQQ